VRDNHSNESMDEIKEIANINDKSKEKKTDLKRDNSTINYYCDPVLNDANGCINNTNIEFDNFVYKNFNSLDDTNRNIAKTPNL